MTTQLYRLWIERRDADRNMARFYALSIEETLFGQTCLVRRWGRRNHRPHGTALLRYRGRSHRAFPRASARQADARLSAAIRLPDAQNRSRLVDRVAAGRREPGEVVLVLALVGAVAA
ncbi:mlr9297 (plasmid) [Mesorhizobium japonicum MAFF 303099]|uniref:Mlr9297 protein n=1 Tax=Mesorhizobium japonicum (strain LMG 29417 / CECT 9101 / MAFF 303099) TaxID=266835 RepID=Q981N7_RHILO|nr:mlr9297 [Mesorhizobium japonicum MAFF 303099]